MPSSFPSMGWQEPARVCAERALGDLERGPDSPRAAPDALYMRQRALSILDRKEESVAMRREALNIGAGRGADEPLEWLRAALLAVGLPSGLGRTNAERGHFCFTPPAPYPTCPVRLSFRSSCPRSSPGGSARP
jgi:hypothetical protein